MSSFQNMDGERMHLQEEVKENSDTRQSLQALLMKPKERKPNQRVDIINENLRSWDTSSTAYLNSQLYKEAEQDKK